MNNRLASAIALLLIAAGAILVAYAALSLRHSPTEPSRPPAPSRAERPVPTHIEEPDSESAAAVTPSPSTPSSAVLAAAPAKRPADLPDSSDRTAARRQAAVLWLGLALPLLFITFVLIVVLRRLRPPPMKHTGPSDTTDLWQEAGRRMK